MNLLENPILKILNGEYEVGALVGNPLPVHWAAGAVLKEQGVEVAKEALKQVNRYREKYGVMPAYFDYGHPLF